MPPRRAVAVAALQLALVAALLAPNSAALGSFGTTANGAPVCLDGHWTEVPDAAIASHKQLPTMQCWRDPPCIRWNYLDREKCRRMKADTDYPTRDPHLTVSPEMKTIRDVVQDYLMNKTVFFVGDSINGQVYQAALCEIVRWGLTLVSSTQGGGHPFDGSHPALTARVRAYWRQHSRFGHIHQATGGRFWLGDASAELEVIPETGTLVVPKGWHKFKASDAAGYLSLADVVVVNYGLHYHGPEGHPELTMSEYEAEMRKLFALLEGFAKLPGKAALFRETSAQHFEGTGSFSNMEQAHPGKGAACRCEKMAPEVEADNDITKMNAIVAKLAAEHPRVKVLPFYALTAPRFDMHEQGYCGFEQMRSAPDSDGSCCDCTHMCHTPQFWRHVFAGMHEQLAGTHATEPAPAELAVLRFITTNTTNTTQFASMV